MTKPIRTYHIIRQKRSPSGWQAVDFDKPLDEILSQPFDGRYALIQHTQRRSNILRQRLVTVHKTITTGTDYAAICKVKSKLEKKRGA
jgi:hypothetical protein